MRTILGPALGHLTRDVLVAGFSCNMLQVLRPDSTAAWTSFRVYRYAVSAVRKNGGAAERPGDIGGPETLH